MNKIELVTIRYSSSHGTTPSNVQVNINEQLTSDKLPKLVADNYKFIGWVHLNKDGHESSLSERMIISTDWLVQVGESYQVVFTAKWLNNRQQPTSEGTPYEGDYVVIPKVTEQILPTENKLMVDDLTVRSIPYSTVSNPAGGSTVYIGSEI